MTWRVLGGHHFDNPSMIKFKDLSIKEKLVTLMTSASLVILILAFSAFVVMEVLTIPKLFLKDLSMLSGIIGVNCTSAIVFNDREYAAKTLSALKERPSIVLARIYTPDGGAFAQYARGAGEDLPPDGIKTDLKALMQQTDQGQWEGHLFFDNYFDVFKDIVFNNETIGIVYLKMDMTELYARFKYYGNMGMLIFAVIFVTSYIVAVMLQRYISRPIIGLEQTMKTISENQNYTVRAQKTAEDEMGSLMDGFNEMLEQIQLRDETLKQYREHLEETVQHRTREVVKANEDLTQAYDKLKNVQAQLIQSAKLASIGELAAGVAHELNQPLMVIRGTAQLVRRSREKNDLQPEELTEYIESIEKNTKRMMNVINHLRTFSRQSGFDFSLVNINEILENAFSMIKEHLRLRNIQVVKEYDPDLPAIHADPNQLEQVFINLIANARDAMEEAEAGEGRTSRPGILKIITRICGTNGSMVEILFSDNGSGIALDAQERILEPFFTTKEVGKGTGLGLSISYGIIQSHHGSLELAATGPDGTTFQIRLPIKTPGKKEETHERQHIDRG